MAVVIRLRRMGAKKDPKFRIVVAESKSPRDGRFVDELGSYNAQPKEIELRVNTERAQYWLSVGAMLSDQVKSLFKKAGVALPVRATKPKKKKKDATPKGTKPAKAKVPPKRVAAKKARVAAKAAAPKKKPSAKKAADKKTGKK
jgi:small subunit ribosomal protein S16